MVLTDRLDPETRMEELFEDGQDIVYYDSADDAIDKVNYYTEHPQERERIAANGKRKVLGQHTVAHRVDVLEDVIERIQNDIIGVAS
jgi:spore maturation protein CgeB